MKDLIKQKVSSRLIKNAHLLPHRLNNVPKVLITRGGFVDNVLKIDDLLAVAGVMRKAYCHVIEEMRGDRSQDALGLIDDLEENLSIMRRDYNVEGKMHL
eukprot:3806031-Karenia_brevis.AAC.1